ncbi:chitinase A1-like [Halichondria panicea]|uniref:chitinase A1-like n=1 Tax=Halichondria panicea TaxID=6063 RepID=UPI00312BBF76
MEFGYCKPKAAVSNTLTILALVLFCVFAAAKDEANVLSFQAERDLIPVGRPMSYSCKVKGRAVWEFGTYYFNTASSDFVGNRSNIIEGVNITDFTDASSPTSPGNLRVVSERQKEVTLMWEPSFLAFNISPQYKVYVDGVIKATTEQNYFVFSKLEHSCDSHQIRVEAYNEVGSNTSEHIEVVLPAVPEVGALSDSISTDITKSGAQVQFTVSFNQAVSCPAHPVTNYTVTLTSSMSTPITRTVAIPPEDSVSITVGGLNDNTLYTYQVHANNVIGSASTAMKTFYTTDVRRATAIEMNNDTLFLHCEFLLGSNALGCQLNKWLLLNDSVCTNLGT